jgi:hypothetical protein
MSERRFNEREVATIIERASARQEGGAQMVGTGAATGMTLAELQAIGREVGIDSREIAEAADTLATSSPTTVRGMFGFPLRVERIVPLPRRLTDEEWERVVVDLRETFDARGVMKAEGSLRQWTNGNLQALLEPTTNGQRIRLRTYKADAMPRLLAALFMIAVPGATMVSTLTSGAGEPGNMLGLGVLAAAGAAWVGLTAVRLSKWARTRGEQMEGLAVRLRRLTSG